MKISATSVRTVARYYRKLLNAINKPTKVIFVSVAAVNYGMPLLRRFKLFRPHARFLAIGAATAHALTKRGETCVFVPTKK
ncbi:MAG: hypothetical protein HC782_04120 [Gammaproteobacteria bacterium]|nr:hypothetical protein [Gammaproteobacteria bacterium]